MSSSSKTKATAKVPPPQADSRKLGRKLKGVGYPCGEETRSRIVESAIALFGLHSMAGTTTRAIAERAEVALPALQYYFASKEGLYLACVEHIASHMGERMLPLASRIQARVDAGELSGADLTALVHELLDGMCDLILGPDVPEGWIPFILREQANPGPGFEVIRSKALGRVMGLFSALLLQAARPAVDPMRVRLGVLELLGNVLVFRTARNVAFQMLQCSEIDRYLLNQIKAHVRAHADQVLASLRL